MRRSILLPSVFSAAKSEFTLLQFCASIDQAEIERISVSSSFQSLISSMDTFL